MRILNKRYWPVKIKLDFDDDKISEAIHWSNESLGQDNFRIIGSSTFYFKNKEDAMMFKLKWS